MRSLLLLLALSSAAAASERSGGVVGFGTSFAHDDPGWMFRVESRSMSRVRGDADEGMVIGGRAGLELWSAGGSTGFAMPIGFAVGGQTDLARATLGAGLGLWAFDFGGGSGNTSGGVAPYVSSALDFTVGKVLVSIDMRVSRQVVSEQSDYNVYSVLLMFGGMGR